MQSIWLRTTSLVFLAALLAGASFARFEPPHAPAGLKTFETVLALRAMARGGRHALHTDPVEAAYITGRLARPVEGRPYDGDETHAKWETRRAGADGWFELRGYGYAWAAFDSPREQVAILEASGHGMVYVNGEPRVGDPYMNGNTRLPVHLRMGENEFLFTAGRGRLRARLVEPAAQAYVDSVDPTLPDLIRGAPDESLAAVVVVNASRDWLRGGQLEAQIDDGTWLSTPSPALPPCSTRKVGLRLPSTTPKGQDAKLLVRLTGLDENIQSGPAQPFTLRVRDAESTHRRTFRSRIDGSVQYFAVTPRRGPEPNSGTGLVLTLHGAGVEAQGQADAYSGKDWCHIVAPTNRRPFGFDWEDWGRLDAIEVLDLASESLKTDPRRTYLTGHSMGGHGTWHVGLTFADRFAAIAPSAGWVSFWSYAGGRRMENAAGVEALLQRASNASDTLALARNSLGQGVYVLHGDADDNVPVSQARTMRQHLGTFHPDFAYYERPGAGHWWGNECVDWPPLFEFLKQRKLPERKETSTIDFSTANPGVSSRYQWATIEQQTRPWELSRLQLRQDVARRSFSGVTANVSGLTLDVGHLSPGQPIDVKLDDDSFPGVVWPTHAPRLHFKREAGKWTQCDGFSAKAKNSMRSGSFKDAFRNRMVLVFGTQGNPAENAWALARARYDAESFWYRGNGSIDIVSDREFALNRHPDRNVILYGNSSTNAAWSVLLPDSPVWVDRTGVRIGDKTFERDDICCLFIRPRPDSSEASVGVVGGTGIRGLRLTERMPYFVSGAAFPDLLVVSPAMLTEGAAGVVAAGFFGNDWGVSSGDFVGLEK